MEEFPGLSLNYLQTENQAIVRMLCSPKIKSSELIVVTGSETSRETRPLGDGNSARPAARFGPLVRQTLGG
jgi:hypothetical protein